MRIIGVLDVMGGAAVRGVGGRREEYRPIGEPLAVARSLMGMGVRELYVADLDAIRTGIFSVPLYEGLPSLGVPLLIDCGVRTRGPTGPWRVVAALETLAGPEWLDDSVVFSLDLKAGVPLAWSDDPRTIIATAVERGVRSMIVLDLARVGTGLGAGTDELLAWMRPAYPHLEIIAGGGIAGRDDLARLFPLGVDGVLVGSALHDGRLTARDLSGW
jgi:phosphoribosylformimino-5-aminoimidazole carboxamide ribotide isomerase